jgi:hypothetical protein
MAEIDDNELRILRGSKAVMDKLVSNPETKYQAEALIKKNHPNVVTTADRAKPFVDRMNATDKKIDDFITEIRNTKADGELNSSFGRLRSAGYTDEGIDKIKKIMIDEKIGNPEAVAAWWEKQNPPEPQEPSVFAPSDWGFGASDAEKDEHLKLQWSDEDRWADIEAGRAIKDYRKSGREY